MEKNKSDLNIVIAAGGTGGHLFPAQALALELIEKHPKMQITFIGAGLGKNVYFKKDIFPFLEIKSSTPFRKHPWKIFKALLLICRGVIHSTRYFSKKKPDLIVGFGSYHTFPAIFAAKLKKVPIIIFESNALPGRVNRFCSRWAKLSVVQFSHSVAYMRSSSVCVKMPLLRKNEGMTKREARDYFKLESDKQTILVFGGSQGAQAINRFFCESIDFLKNRGFDFQVIHIVGDNSRAEKLCEMYAKKGVLACVKAFEEKMEYAWNAADLSISRAGSATLAELIEFAVPSILIPYPYGAENHQEKNAAFIAEEVRGALAIEERDLTGERLSKAILSCFGREKELKEALLAYREKEKEKEELSGVVLKVL